MRPFALRFGVVDLFAYLHETLALAPAVEALGYARYWITENPTQPSPILVSALVGGLTEQIRVGTAALLFHFYSPAKAAYDFQMLEAAYPERIDAGFCAGWAGPQLLPALLDGRPEAQHRDPIRYQQRVRALIDHLRATPTDPLDNPAVWLGAAYQPPELWVHGTGAGAATLAAEHGISLGLALFNGKSLDPGHIAAYRRHFQANGAQPAPRLAIAVAGICAESDQAAQMLLADRRPSGHHANIVGGIERWRCELAQISERYQPDEIVVMDLCGRYEDRLASYTLLAEAVGLAPLHSA